MCNMHCRNFLYTLLYYTGRIYLHNSRDVILPFTNATNGRVWIPYSQNIVITKETLSRHIYLKYYLVSKYINKTGVVFKPCLSVAYQASFSLQLGAHDAKTITWDYQIVSRFIRNLGHAILDITLSVRINSYIHSITATYISSSI